MTNHTNGSGPAVNPFDPNALRLSQDFIGMAGEKKELTVVRVRKPSKQDWFRVHPDEAFRGTFGMIHLKEEGEYYMVAPEMAPALTNEMVHVSLYTVINRQGVVSLWPIPLPPPDGKDNDWWVSARDAAARAMTRWIRITPNKSLGANEIMTGPDNMAEPEWPKKTLAELFQIAFGQGLLVDRLDHPVVKRLRGLA
jgi:hypothetical protein